MTDEAAKILNTLPNRGPICDRCGTTMCALFEDGPQVNGKVRTQVPNGAYKCYRCGNLLDPKSEAKAVLQTLTDTLGESITITPADVVALGQLAHEREAALIAHKLRTWQGLVDALKAVRDDIGLNDLIAGIGETPDFWVQIQSAILVAERLP